MQLHFLCHLPLGSSKQQQSITQHYLNRENSVLSAFLCMPCSPIHSRSWRHSTELAPVHSCPSQFGEPKTRHSIPDAAPQMPNRGEEIIYSTAAQLPHLLAAFVPRANSCPNFKVLPSRILRFSFPNLNFPALFHEAQGPQKPENRPKQRLQCCISITALLSAPSASHHFLKSSSH